MSRTHPMAAHAGTQQDDQSPNTLPKPAFLSSVAAVSSDGFNTITQLIQLLHIHIGEDEDPWDAYFYACFTQNLVASCADLSALNIYSKRATFSSLLPRQRELDCFLEQAGGAPLQGLLRFLQIRQQYFKSRPVSPFKEIIIGTSCAEAKREPNHALALTSLEVLCEHLVMQGAYFPFEIVTICIPEYQSQHFKALENTLRALAHHPHVKQVRLLTQDSLQETVLTSTQYHALEKLVRDCTLAIQIQAAEYQPCTQEPVLHGDGICSPLVGEAIPPAVLLSNECNRQIRQKCIKQMCAESEALVHQESANDAAPLDVVAVAEPALLAFERVAAWKYTDTEAPRTTVATEHAVTAARDIARVAEQQHMVVQEHEVAQAILDQAQLIDLVKYQELHTYVPLRSQRTASSEQWQKLREKHFPYDPALSQKQIPTAQEVRSTVQAQQRTFWCNVTANHADRDNNFRYMTQEAMERIHEFSDHFQGGIHFDNLPLGFYAQWYAGRPSGYVLCYNPRRLIERDEITPLTPVLTHCNQFEKWRGDPRQYGAYTSLRKDKRVFWGPGARYGGDPFFPIEPNVAQDVVTQYMNMNMRQGSSRDCAQAARLIQRDQMRTNLQHWMCLLNEVLAKSICESHAWYFENASRRELFALMDILYHQGCEGINRFLTALHALYDAKNPKLYGHVKDYYLNGHIDDGLDKTQITKYVPVMTLMTPDCLRIMSQLHTLTPTEQTWLIQIDKCFYSTIGHLELETIHKGLRYFIAEFKQLFPMEPHIALPTVCPLKEGIHPFAQLDRLLFILKQVSEQNRQDQLQYLSAIDLSAEGDWYAAKWDGFHFFHSEMHINPADKKKYQISFEAFKNIQSVNEAVCYFHRMAARSVVIQAPYQKYCDLIDCLTKKFQGPKNQKTLLLAIKLFAVITQSPDGLPADDEITQCITAITGCQTANNVLTTALAKLTSGHERVTCASLTALIAAANAMSPELLNLLCATTADPFKIFDLWEKNPCHCKMPVFSTVCTALYNSKISAFSCVAQFIAVLDAQDATSQERNVFLNAIQTIQAHRNYFTLMQLLAVIDTTKPRPTLVQFTTILTKLQTRFFDSKAAIIVFLQEQIPDFCVLPISSVEPPQNEQVIRTKIAALNAISDTCQFDAHVLTTEAVCKHYQVLMDTPHLNADKKTKITSAVSDLLRSTFLVSVFVYIKTYPGLQNLEKLYPEFEMTAGGFWKLQEAVQNLPRLCNVLIALNKRWSETAKHAHIFQCQFLQSPTVTRYTVIELCSIFDYIQQAKHFQYLPVRLLDALFPNQGDVIINASTLGKIQKIIQFSSLTMDRRVPLIHAIYNNVHITVEELQTLIKVEDPRLFHVGLCELEGKKDDAPCTVLGDIQHLLFTSETSAENKRDQDVATSLSDDEPDMQNAAKDDDDEEQESLSAAREEAPKRAVTVEYADIILNTLSRSDARLFVDLQIILATAKRIQSWSDVDLTIKKKTCQRFLSIIAYGVLQHDYHAEDPTSRSTLLQIVQMLVPEKPTQQDIISNLYALSLFFENIPRPRLAQLQNILDKAAMTRSIACLSVESFQCFPVGQKMYETKLAADCNMSTLHERIDMIQEFTRDATGQSRAAIPGEQNLT